MIDRVAGAMIHRYVEPGASWCGTWSGLVFTQYRRSYRAGGEHLHKLMSFHDMNRLRWNYQNLLVFQCEKQHTMIELSVPLLHGGLHLPGHGFGPRERESKLFARFEGYVDVFLM